VISQVHRVLCLSTTPHCDLSGDAPHAHTALVAQPARLQSFISPQRLVLDDELAIFDPSDHGLTRSVAPGACSSCPSWGPPWSLTGKLERLECSPVKPGFDPGFWSFERRCSTTCLQNGLLVPCAIWHLDLLRIWRSWQRPPALLFERRRSSQDLRHLTPGLAGLGCFVSGGPSTYRAGLWSGDVGSRPYGSNGHRGVAPSWGAEGFNPFNPGGFVPTHCGGGVGIIAAFHITPSRSGCTSLRMGNIRNGAWPVPCRRVFCRFSVLNVWYGSAGQPWSVRNHRYSVDQGYSTEINRRLWAGLEEPFLQGRGLCPS